MAEAFLLFSAVLITYGCTGIYYLTTDRYICTGESHADQLWLYAILQFTIPLVLLWFALFFDDDEFYIIFIALLVTQFSFFIYGSVVFFGGGVCHEQVVKGGLYSWAIIQYILGILTWLSLLLALMNDDEIYGKVKDKIQKYFDNSKEFCAQYHRVKLPCCASRTSDVASESEYNNNSPRSVDAHEERKSAEFQLSELYSKSKKPENQKPLPEKPNVNKDGVNLQNSLIGFMIFALISAELKGGPIEQTARENKTYLQRILSSEIFEYLKRQNQEAKEFLKRNIHFVMFFMPFVGVDLTEGFILYKLWFSMPSLPRSAYCQVFEPLLISVILISFVLNVTTTAIQDIRTELGLVFTKSIWTNEKEDDNKEDDDNQMKLKEMTPSIQFACLLVVVIESALVLALIVVGTYYIMIQGNLNCIVYLL